MMFSFSSMWLVPAWTFQALYLLSVFFVTSRLGVHFSLRGSYFPDLALDFRLLFRISDCTWALTNSLLAPHPHVSLVKSQASKAALSH
jgi:hypothetical protein